jgi:hypothetical protein
MRRGQLFSTDLLLGFVLVVAAIGLVAQSLDVQQKQAFSSVESAKLQSIALDAAAVRYYDKVDGAVGVTDAYDAIGTRGTYWVVDAIPADRSACASAVRGAVAGSIDTRTKVFACRPP